MMDLETEDEMPDFPPGDLIYIYGLVDPFTYEVRYVGKSDRPRQRFRSHINDKSVTHRTNWIRSVLDQGEEPLLLIIEALLPGTDWQQKERSWIAWGRFVGWPLTNGTDGGDGVSGLAPESRDRIRKTWIGRKHSPETRAKIGAASRGREHTEEHKQKMSQAMKGREIAWRDKISAGNKKLSDPDVLEIRRLLALKVPMSRIAKQFNVDPSTIRNIRDGRFYTEVR